MPQKIVTATISKFSMVKHAILSFAGMAAFVGLWALFLKKQLNRTVKVIMLVAVLSLTAFFYARMIEPNWIAVNRVEIDDPALARSLAGLKVVQVSDIHIRKELRFREHQLIRKINELQPDLLFITGDFLENIDELHALEELLKGLTARYGVYGVTGNTDYHRFNIDGLVKQLAPTGLIMLRNEHRRIELGNGKGLWLAGVDDPVNKRDDLTKALAGIPQGEPVLLLAHGPMIFPKAIQAKVNLVLVGHTHGAQVGIPFLVRLSRYANRTVYVKGLFSEGATKMYVNRGIGTKTLPIRLFCRPEIALFEFTARRK